MKKQSIWAVVAGALVAIVVTTLVDAVLHIAHVFPAINEPINDALALLATSYRIVIGVGGAWLTARLAPDRPLKHALILGYLGVALGLVGVVVTWTRDSGLIGTRLRSSLWRCRKAGWAGSSTKRGRSAA